MEELEDLVYYWAANDPGHFINNEEECMKQLENTISEHTKVIVDDNDEEFTSIYKPYIENILKEFDK